MTKREDITEKKRALYHSLLQLDINEYTDADGNIAFELAKDPDMQAIIRKKLLKYPCEPSGKCPFLKNDRVACWSSALGGGLDRNLCPQGENHAS